MAVLVSLLVGVAWVTLFNWVTDHRSTPGAIWRRYCGWWTAKIRRLHVDFRLCRVPTWQGACVATCIAMAVFAAEPLLALLAMVAVVVPPWLLIRCHKRYRAALAEGLDPFLTVLADSLTTVPNLAEALATVLHHMAEPIQNEVRFVLREIRIGIRIDDALANMAKRVSLPGFHAAVGAALLGRHTGGDLPGMFRRIAATVREMARLEGVIRTKTAEGRYQAWVMGSVPPGLIVILEYVDPEWIAPLWRDPIGWGMIGLVAVLEVSAIALIRRIMAVVI